MSNIIPFRSDNLPAYLKRAVDNSNDLMQGASPGLVRLSIEGGRWTIVRGKEDKTPIRHPRDPELFAAAINVIIVKSSPNLARNYFAKKFEKGVDAKPDCFSVDGVRPSPQATDKQCETCQACRHAVYGTGENGKGFRCANFRNLVVAFPDNLEEPMLLRVPGGSLKNLAIFAKELSDTGARAGVVIPYNSVVTKIKFDPNETGQKLIFEPTGMLPDALFERVDALATSSTVTTMLGTTAATPDAPASAQLPSRATIAQTISAADEDEPAATAAPATRKVATDDDEAPAKPAKRRAAAKPAPVVDDEDEAPTPRSRKTAASDLDDGGAFDDVLNDYDD